MPIPAIIRTCATFIFALITSLALAQTPDPRLKNAYTFQKDGWTYAHLEGAPGEISFQHGYLQ